MNYIRSTIYNCYSTFRILQKSVNLEEVKQYHRTENIEDVKINAKPLLKKIDKKIGEHYHKHILIIYSKRS